LKQHLDHLQGSGGTVVDTEIYLDGDPPVHDIKLFL
jgi:translation initiation factor 1 (eIF-1/SUI1)